MFEEQRTDDRHIQIHHDVLGSALVSGDGNKVFIYHYHLDQQAAPEPKVTIPQLAANPYRGLSAFQVEDADVYFGREAQVDRLWNRLRDLHERATQEHLPVRLLPILGPSGSGKSSLARAGLLPELARRPLPGHRQTRVVVMKPGSTPLEALAVVLARIATNDPSPAAKAAEFEQVLRQKSDRSQHEGLRRIANMLPSIDTSPLVILVDQFEEVYSLCKDAQERTAFIDCLIGVAATPEARVSVVITLRLDFVKETQQHPLLNQVIGSDQSAIVPAMTGKELHRAIAEPAKQAGHALDEGIVDRLIEQTEGREGALPLLQFALTRIWEGLGEGRAPSETLKAIGGVGGALAGEAQRIYDSLNSQEKDIARRVFVGLVQLGEGTRDTRRRASVKSLIAAEDDPKQVRYVLDRFSAPGARLITLSTSQDNEIAEVTHEALFEYWQQLTYWLDNCRDSIRQQRKIEASAEEWQATGCKRGYLLQGPQLSEAVRFRKHVKQFPLSKQAELFVVKSLWSQRISRLWLLIFLVVPALVVESALREARIDRLYVDAQGTDRSRQRQAVTALLEGCSREASSRLFPYLADRFFGDCRSLANRNLRGADLSVADLSVADLRGADLRVANLKIANLSGANLSGAELSNAKLFGADFIGADLSGANLRDADLNAADFIGANLRDADLSGANLRDADLRDADLRGADLSGADLSGVTLCQTRLPEGSNLDADRDCER
ncbi:pentapeptide repeat-containing protein [Oculatella sp. FACHB-28]|uniref:nSTAND1 domain-containing NTPase n=1 Tax=Oculatella sp. FACHB-28 TaxID=2692845 RepID=UPI0016843D49|nr:pentapeptide repeat-containing protein [Oculatella sp. FACHB-28]MBD2058120.1 pentapeptide repeat-containing protein [Oculatella sp. FACHB-28]